MTRQTPRDGSARGQWRAEHFNSVLLTHGCECHWVNRRWEACQLAEGRLDSRRLTNDEHLPSFCASKTMWNPRGTKTWDAGPSSSSTPSLAGGEQVLGAGCAEAAVRCIADIPLIIPTAMGSSAVSSAGRRRGTPRTLSQTSARAWVLRTPRRRRGRRATTARRRR